MVDKKLKFDKLILKSVKNLDTYSPVPGEIVVGDDGFKIKLKNGNIFDSREIKLPTSTLEQSIININNSISNIQEQINDSNVFGLTLAQNIEKINNLLNKKIDKEEILEIKENIKAEIIDTINFEEFAKKGYVDTKIEEIYSEIIGSGTISDLYNKIVVLEEDISWNNY